MKKLVLESLLTESRKENLYARLLALNIEDQVAVALCNYFDSVELEGFVVFLEEEFDI